MKLRVFLVVTIVVACISCAPQAVPIPEPVFVPMVTYMEGDVLYGYGQHRQYTLDDPAQACLRLSKLGARWKYDWSANPTECEMIESVGMFYGLGQEAKVVPYGNNWLWYNEPDVASQHGGVVITPQRAATAWNTYRPKYPNVRHGSPAVVDLQWLRDWLPKVNIKPDFLAIHPYVFGGSFDQAKASFRSYLDQAQEIAREYGIGEIWNTEMAWVTSDPRLPEWASWAREEIERRPMIKRAAWFIDWSQGDEPWNFPNSTNLFERDGQTLTPLGMAWLWAWDVNRDSEVDILDLVSVAGHFGEVYH